MNPQSLQQNRSFDKNPIDNAEPFSHMTILSVVTCVMKYIKRAKRLSQALVHLVTDRANLFSDQKMSGLSIRAPVANAFSKSTHFPSEMLFFC